MALASRDRGYVLAGVLLVEFTILGLAVLVMAAWMRQAGQGGELAGVALFGLVSAVSLVLDAMYRRAMAPRGRTVDVEGETVVE